MGNLISEAYTLSGQNIVVAFSADKFEDGSLPQIVAISTQMDGGSEYTALKATTASISFLVDGDELMSLCTAEYPITVRIDNLHTNAMLFHGYIVPNSYNQSLSGVNDILTIECVDLLGYAKYVPYTQLVASSGFKVLTLDDAISRCFYLLGLMQHERIMLPTNVLLGRGSDRFSFTEMRLSEGYFFNSDLPDEVTMDYRPQAMTCEQVLVMIAESLHLTWLCANTDIYLCDLLSNELSYRDVINGDVVMQPVVRDVNENSFASSACSVSSLSRVAMTEVQYTRAESVAAMQNPFNPAYLTKAGEYKEYYNQGKDPYTRVISVPLSSSLYSTYMPSRPGGTPRCYSQFVAWQDNKSLVPKPGTPYFTDNYAWGDNGWTVALKMGDTAGAGELVELLRRKAEFSTPVMGEPGGRRYLNIAAQISIAKLDDGVEDDDGSKTEYMNSRLFPQNEKTINCKLNVSVIVGGLYFNPNNRKWVPEKTIFRVNIYADGTAQWDIYGLADDKREGIVIPSSGQLEFVIYSNGEGNTGWEVAWLKKLELTLKGDAYAQREDLLRPTIQRVGSWDINRVQRLAPPLEVYYNMSNKPLMVPALPDGSTARPSLIYNIDEEELSLPEYAHALANKGDRKMFEISLRDDANALSPLDAFVCAQLWKGRKTMTGYSRDVINNQITVTLV